MSEEGMAYRKANRMIGRLARRAYRMSARDAVLGLKRIVLASRSDRPAQSVRPTEPTEAFLRSAEYATLMSMHLPYDGSHDLHEAQNETRNFRFRHHECAERLGVYRWRGVQRHLDSILSLITAPGARVIDFGGAGGPLGFGSAIVDRLEQDAWGRPVRLRSLAEAGVGYDVVFSSHALEHVAGLDGVLASMAACLRKGGHLLLHVPAFSCNRWRAGVHSSSRYTDHAWTFGLGPEPAGVPCTNYADLVSKLGGAFSVEVAEYCGDDSIFIRARRSE